MPLPTLGTALIEVLDALNPIVGPGVLDLTPNQATIHCVVYAGGKVGADGAVAEAAGYPLALAQQYPIRQLTTREISNSGGLYEHGDIIIECIPPAYSDPVTGRSGGYTLRQLSPRATANGTDVYYEISGTHAGYYKVVELRTDQRLTWSVVLTRTATHPMVTTPTIVLPSSMAGLNSWFRADSNVTFNGSKVASIGDKSGAGVLPSLSASGAQQPTFLPSGIGGLPDIQWSSVTGLVGSSALLGTTGVSLFAIIQTTDATADRIVWGMRYALFHYSFDLNRTSNLLSYTTFNSTIAYSAAAINDGAPHFVVSTWSTSDNTARLYVDGALQSTVTSASVITNPATDYNAAGCGSIGPGTIVGSYTGQMPEWGSFSRALTAAEVATLTTYGKNQIGT